MTDYKKKKHPLFMIVIQAAEKLVIAIIFSYIFVAPLYIFGIRAQSIVDIFVFPPNIIPQPYNFVGILLISMGMMLLIWANYALLYIGKIGLKDREPMHSPCKLVKVGPYRFTRNPIYFGCLLMLLGFVIICSSLLLIFLLIGVYILFRFVFIKREEIILEEKFMEDYQKYKKHVRRWL